MHSHCYFKPGIANINKIDNFNIYPNPVKSELDVEFNSASDQSVIMIYSTMGQLLISRNIENAVGMTTMSIPVDNLGNGIYCIEIIQNGNVVSTKKFVKN